MEEIRRQAEAAVRELLEIAGLKAGAGRLGGRGRSCLVSVLFQKSNKS